MHLVSVTEYSRRHTVFRSRFHHISIVGGTPPMLLSHITGVCMLQALDIELLKRWLRVCDNQHP